MGNRVSISFRNNKVPDFMQESVALFSHWGGMQFVKEAQAHADTLPRDSNVAPLDRLEPNTVMVDFIRHITKDKDHVRSDLYLGATPEDGDNSDNGHHLIDLLDPVGQTGHTKEF
jgi:hypothetical protein|tara:strand:+ start:338 stop:682 length:345 start_codon:yes stop_codon:yes gene_type:complete